MVRVASLALLVILVNPTLASYPITEEKMQNGPPCSIMVWRPYCRANDDPSPWSNCCLRSRETTEQGMGSEGDQKAVEIASSPESLSMAADDFADAMQNARRAIGRALRPNRANAESQQFRRRHSKCASLEFSGNALSRNAPLPMGSTFRCADKEKPWIRSRAFSIRGWPCGLNPSKSP
jgi:hypothetical protein